MLRVDIGATAKCSYAKEMVDVEFDENKLTDAAIKETIRKAGYQIV